MNDKKNELKDVNENCFIFNENIKNNDYFENKFIEFIKNNNHIIVDKNLFVENSNNLNYLVLIIYFFIKDNYNKNNNDKKIGYYENLKKIANNCIFIKINNDLINIENLNIYFNDKNVLEYEIAGKYFHSFSIFYSFLNENLFVKSFLK